MLNDEDIIKLKSILSTKEDIKDLRTELKQEISNSQDNILSLLATKQELQEVKNDMADLKE